MIGPKGVLVMSMESNESSSRGLRWVLLVVAIIVVVVLLVLLMKGKKSKKVSIVEPTLPVTPELIVSPRGPVDWSDTNVGESRAAEFTVSANTRAQVTGVVVRVDGDTSDAVGVSATETCTNENTIIDEEMPCVVRLAYRPEHALNRTTADVAIKWTAFETGVETEDADAITVVIGARELPKPKPEPMPEPEPANEPDIFDIAEPEYAPEPTYDFEQDVEDISPDFDFDDVPMPTYSAPAPAPTATSVKPKSTFGSACSDFSFPGYNMSGVHSGWIKPSGGAYYYHTFADVNCQTPTGIYNPDTGYIMDISNPARRIGSDAEHIRLTMTDRLPELGSRTTRNRGNRARQLSNAELDVLVANGQSGGGMAKVNLTPNEVNKKMYVGSGELGGVFSSRPYDRTFVLRQYKPIPATIVSDIQADSKLLTGGLPVRATVDRNVYSDNGRTVIIPTGTLMLGYVTGELPGPYKAVGRMQIEWYQFIRPDGVEFNFVDNDKPRPFSADSQGRKGVPGHGSTDYLQQFIMPMLTAIVPAAVNLIAPISDAFVNQIDLDNNTVVQSGTVRSSELAKNEIITAWNNVAAKLLVDVLDNTTPPFSIAAGTRITVFSPVDLYVTCGDDGSKSCAFHPYGADSRADWRKTADKSIYQSQDMEELLGQVRSLMQSSLQDQCCESTDGTKASTAKANWQNLPTCKNYSFATLDFYCRSFGTYDAINNAKQQAVFQNQQQNAVQKTDYSTGTNTVEYNTQVLGLEYKDDGTIKNPFKKEAPAAAPAATQTSAVVTCGDGANPDANGCCPGETYTDMGDQGFNCCPDAGGDCFPPIVF